jgi:ribosomal protein L37AE/L43A
MLYRVLHAIHEWYAIAVFWIFLTVFLLSFPMIFFFPPGPILLVFFGLGFLGLAVVVGKALRGTLHATARHALARGVCPRCRQPHEISEVGQPSEWRCAACGTAFDASGAEIQPQTQEVGDRSPRMLLDSH